MQSKIIIEERQGEILEAQHSSAQKKFYIESYGCAMNFSDSEIVASILQDNGFGTTKNLEEADLVLINTCSIREKAEQTIRKRLALFRSFKRENKEMLIGVLGCMAERLKGKLLEEEKLVDLVIGPDAYRSLPTLVAEAGSGQAGVNVLLSREETYAELSPIRLDTNGVSAYISIMRGCDNMCSFCVVPFTRGRERSRSAESILAEAQDLIKRGYKEVTLLGQNVDSYRYEQEGYTITFAKLLVMVAELSPTLRVRFSTSHPKDITDEVLYAIRDYDNICNYLHLPVQSGSSRILKLMNRTYTREWYMAKIDSIRRIVPECAISSDIIAGFCTETEADHADTLSIMQYGNYDLSYMYAYSERPGTLAARKYADDVSEADKLRRLQEVISLQRSMTVRNYAKDVGCITEVLIEGESKRSSEEWSGRNSQNKMVVFPKESHMLRPGSYAKVLITASTGATLQGRVATDN